MDPDALGVEAAARQRARLHIRAGRRRLRQGKISHGLGSLFDALLFAMQYYIASPERRMTLPIKEADDLRDDHPKTPPPIDSLAFFLFLGYINFKMSKSGELGAPG